ncbi:uncharacterized protein B0H18DRAFT_1213985 [Fomitopsis serialis]|uniref:uncharacterized protein n=1 Tax=Fomitopsis serialis TaxID=139415 RepID=UPI0020085EB0|nr:uncharacterized protein B0H18DRAFT_1213985 [Neoantrodia serialis]KAH9919130.1 hypothetical protein B0H18DRAFT_1213985 [Neoantrodia serialis]
MMNCREARLLAKAAHAAKPRRGAPLNTLRTAKVSQPTVSARLLSSPSRAPVPAIVLPWLRRPTLSPNSSMWVRRCVPIMNLSLALDKMTLDPVPSGAMDDLCRLFSKMSVEDVPPAAIDDLCDALARLSLNDPAMDDLANSFAGMTLGQHSESVEDLAPMFGQFTLHDSTPESCDVLTEVPVTQTDLQSAPTEKEPIADVIELNTQPGGIEDNTYLPLYESDLVAGAILPLGTRPGDWHTAAEPVSSGYPGHAADSEWTPLEWGKRQIWIFACTTKDSGHFDSPRYAYAISSVPPQYISIFKLQVSLLNWKKPLELNSAFCLRAAVLYDTRD